MLFVLGTWFPRNFSVEYTLIQKGLSNGWRIEILSKHKFKPVRQQKKYSFAYFYKSLENCV